MSSVPDVQRGEGVDDPAGVASAPGDSPEHCEGCRWLFVQQRGYSNWTVTDEDLCCVQKHAVAELPGDYAYAGIPDKWWRARTKRCPLYERAEPFDPVVIDVEEGKLLSREAAEREFMSGNFMPLLIRKTLGKD